MEQIIYLLLFAIFLIAFLVQIIKKYNILYLFIVLFILFDFCIYIFFVNITDDDSSGNLADGFTIEAYDVFLDVSEDNTVDVTEKITVNWYEDYHHGIYKFTPYWLQYTAKDGKIYKRKSNIIDYRAVDDNYSIDEVKRKARIKIGSPYEYVPLGNKTYTIKYTYDMGRDPFKDFDEFIFHAYGNYWGTEIKNATLEVNMPKSIEDYKINFFTDKYRKENVTEMVDFNVSGKRLTAKFNELRNGGNYLTKSLTVDVELPNNYFSGGSYNYGFISICLIFIIVLITIFIIFMWYKYGKDYPKNVRTVEFYPPDELSSAEIGYIYKKSTNNKLTISLIIELASKGYIKIDEIDNKIKITNLLIKPKEVVKDNTKNERIIEVKKIKNIDDNISSDAKTMMIYLFQHSNNKIIKSNINKFLTVRDELVNGGYIEVLSDNEEYLMEKDKYNEIKYHKEIKAYENEEKIYKEKLASLPEISELEKIVFDRLFDNDDVFFLNENKGFYLAFNEVNNILETKTSNLVNDTVATEKTYISMILNFIMLIIYFISYYIEDLDPNLSFLYLIPLLCIITNLFFIMFMKRKTIYGEQIYAKVMGFRDFLIKVEKDNLESLVEKDPKYFYNILPYTYVLGISKKWIKKFENIPMPDVDMGNFNYTNERSFYDIYDNVYHPVSSGSSSGSGCSSCGGGCSSCGGGCSSCGGGGSW